MISAYNQNREPMHRPKFKEILRKPALVWHEYFDTKRIDGYWSVFKSFKPEYFNAGVNYMLKNAQFPAPKWIFEGMQDKIGPDRRLDGTPKC